MEKIRYSYNDIHRIIASAARNINAEDFDLMLAIGGGGFIPARILRTFLNLPIYTVTLQYYVSPGLTKKAPRIEQWLDDPASQIQDKRILLVDEVDDSRATLAYCANALLKHHPKSISVFALHNKIKSKAADFPDVIKKIHYGQVIPDIWVSYPWDATEIESHILNKPVETIES